MPDTTGYQVTIGERVVHVELRRQGELTYARVDGGDERPVQLGTVHGTLRSLGIGVQRAELLAARSGEAVRVCLGGLDFRADVLDARRAQLAGVAGAAGPGHARRELKAPMPGLVVKLLCQVGDTVADGQPLAVLQAMKMENELSLPRGGVVQSVTAEAGQTVEQGQVLVVLE
jgi:propionyl-CoA carboxylase alpha subunit